MVVLFGFRALNEINHAARSNFNVAAVTDWNVWLAAFKGSFDRALSLVPILLLTIATPRYPKIYFVIFYVAAFSIGRFLLNEIIYRNSGGTPWSNVLVAPVFFICVVTVVGFVSNRLPRRTFYTVSFLTICLSLVWSIRHSIETDTANKIKSFLAGSITSRFDPNEIQEIRSKVPAANSMGYVVIEEHLMERFMDRSHVSDQWLLRKPSEFQHKVTFAADFLILSKGNQLASRLAADTQRFFKVTETNSFVCFRPSK